MQNAQVIFANVKNGITDSPSTASEDPSISRIHQFLVVLPTCAVSLSLGIYAVQQLRQLRTRKQEGLIRLPENGRLSRKPGTIRLEDGPEHEEEKALDVWDIQDEEMEIDGYPIEEEAFWRKVCPLRYLQTLRHANHVCQITRRNSKKSRSYCSFYCPPLRISSHSDTTFRCEMNSTYLHIYHGKRCRRSPSRPRFMSTRFSCACFSCRKRRSPIIGPPRFTCPRSSSSHGSVNFSM